MTDRKKEIRFGVEKFMLNVWKFGTSYTPHIGVGDIGSTFTISFSMYTGSESFWDKLVYIRFARGQKNQF